MMKKILLSLGTIAAVVAPVVSVVSCGSTQKVESKADVVVSFNLDWLNKEKLTADTTGFMDTIENIKSKFEEINMDTKSIEVEILDGEKSLIDVTVKFGEGLKAIKDKISELQSVLASEMKTLIPEIMPAIKEKIANFTPQIKQKIQDLLPSLNGIIGADKVGMISLALNVI